MSGSGARMLREQLERVDERATARRAATSSAWPIDADDVAEVDVDLARAVDRAEELDPARAVDEVEEGRASPSRGAPGRGRRAGARRRLLARLERLGLGADGGDLVAVREALRRPSGQVYRAALRRIIQACGPSSGVSPLAHDLEAVAAVEGEVRARRSSAARTGGRRGAAASRPGAISAQPMPLRRSTGLDADPGEVPVRLRARRGRASPRPRGRRRGSATSPRATPQRRRDERAQHRADVHSGARAAASGRSRATAPARRPDLRLGHLEARSGRATAAAPRGARAFGSTQLQAGRPGTRARARRSPRRAAPAPAERPPRRDPNAPHVAGDAVSGAPKRSSARRRLRPP